MIDIDEALQLVLSRVHPTSSVTIPVAESLGHVLAADVASDIDSPPHDKSMMDGYAVRSEDLESGTADLRVLEEVVAGAVPTVPLRAGEAIRIMTGAPIPQHADAVVMLEQSEMLDTGDSPRVRILAPTVKSGQNIMRQATSIACGQTVLAEGTRIRAIEIGLLCEVGCGQVPVRRRPQVAVLPTGDELVSVTEQPGPGQIRNSNGPMLAALAHAAGADACELPVGRDRKDLLETQIQQGLQHDVLLLSGGVSAGSRDLVPAVLEAMGVRQIFHKVRLRPGKPLWFGVRESHESRGGGNTLVFGLPGNPVSSLVCFEVFVRPALAKLAGLHHVTRPRIRASLACPHSARGDRPTFFPVRLSRDQPPTVEPLKWHGSADLRTLAEADGLAYFPAGDREYETREEVDVHPLG